MTDINLKSVTIESFMGIDKSNPIVLDLGKYYAKGKNITTLAGNQGTCKTSTINALLFLLGVNFDFDKDNLINLNDDTIHLENEFEVDGEQYRVKATKSRFVLEKFYQNPGKSGKWIPEGSPKETLRTLIGNIGMSPMFLKDKKGKEQIEWFRKTFSDEENSKKELALLTKLKQITDARREANKEYNRLKNVLNSNDLYINWEDSEKRFAKPVSIEAAKEKVDLLKKGANDYRLAQDRIELVKNSINTTKQTIESLKEQLAQAEKDLVTLEERKEVGDKYIAEHAMIVTEYEEAEQEYMNISQVLVEQNQWKETQKLKAELDEAEDLVQQADAKKDKIKTDLLKVTKKYLPEIDELEIKIATGLDDEEEGIYYQKKTMAQLSESELWALFFKIWEQKDVRFVFIENISSLGTDAVGVVNMLAEHGVKIFATMMDRKKESMKISFTDSIS